MAKASLLGFASGIAVTIGVSAGGASDSASVSNWGQGATGSATVTASRGQTSATGEAIVLTANSFTGVSLSSGTFVEYDPEFHEIEGVWTVTGPDGTTVAAPTRAPASFGTRKTDYGTRMFYIPRVAGSYTFDFWGSDPNGNTVAGSITEEVVDIDSLITADRTIILYDGSDLAGAPTHNSGNRYTTWSAATAALKTAIQSGVSKLAILGGHTVNVDAPYYTSGNNSASIIESYGTGRGSIHIQDSPIAIGTSFSGVGDVIIRNIRGIGDWNMATQTGAAAAGTPTAGDPGFFKLGTTTTNIRVSVSESYFGGLYQAFNVVLDAELYLEDVEFADHINYDVYFNGTAFGARFCSFDNNPDALVGGLRDDGGIPANYYRNIHGNFRSTSAGNVEHLFSRCSFLTRNSWSWNGGSTWLSTQACMRLRQTASPGGYFQIQRNVIEGSIAAVTFQSGNYPANILLDGNIIIDLPSDISAGNHDAPGAPTIMLGMSGTTIRNNVGVMPDVTLDPGASTNRPFIGYDTVDNTNGDPVRVYGNTRVDLRTGNPTYNFSTTDPVEQFPDLIEVNNLEYAPNYSGGAHSPDGALETLAGATAINGPAALGFTNQSFTLSSLSDGSTSALIPWFNDIDGLPVDDTTFSGGLGAHSIRKTTTEGRPVNAYFLSGHPNGNNISMSITASGVTITNNTGGTIDAGTYWLQLDRRHDIVSRAGSANPATSGQLWRPVSNVTPDVGLVPILDIFGNVRTAATKGAIEAA